MNEKQQKGRQVPCEHFNLLEIYGGKKNPYLCTDGASIKKHAYEQKKSLKSKKKMKTLLVKLCV